MKLIDSGQSMVIRSNLTLNKLISNLNDLQNDVTVIDSVLYLFMIDCYIFCRHTGLRMIFNKLIHFHVVYCNNVMCVTIF